ncbi:BMC domain-containing protein [Lacticaseibacillus baoqingensis]|uniref:BMC domain-containing protein n=1 Tax=Lacticaseibacillus baoqingensis TaxID=2486013 RepID=A0ABW4EAR4_9LACO|nr:BMC domain-containing protein [Lacticaseibacillus baoqingensis]
MQALGMVETRGLIAAIEATDVMLKTADVHLINQEYVRGGLVATLMGGDVAAIQTAVDAATTAVRRLSEDSLFTTDVIPRPDGMLDLIVQPTPPAAPQPKMTAVAPTAETPVDQAATTAATDEPATPPAPAADPSTPTTEAKPKAAEPNKLDAAYFKQIVADKAKAAAYLGQFKINELRNFAKKQAEFIKQHKNVYQLSKNSLVNLLIDFYQNEA